MCVPVQMEVTISSHSRPRQVGVLPKQVSQLLDSSAPEQVGQRVEVPHVELVVQRAAEAHADEVRGEQDQYHL